MNNNYDETILLWRIYRSVAFCKQTNQIRALISIKRADIVGRERNRLVKESNQSMSDASVVCCLFVRIFGFVAAETTRKMEQSTNLLVHMVLYDATCT